MLMELRANLTRIMAAEWGLPYGDVCEGRNDPPMSDTMAEAEERVADCTQAPLRARASLPLTPFARPEFSDADRARLDAIASRLLAEEPALRATSAFGNRVTSGIAAAGPALVFEDHSALGLYWRRQIVWGEYRALLLAGDGDFIAIGEHPDPAFENYCREILELGAVERLVPDAGQTPLVRLGARILKDANVMNRLIDAAQRHGVISLVPYYGNGGCWALGREIAARSGAEVRIASAPPRLTARVNDKLWFADRVADLLGRRARPMTYYAYGPAALAAMLRTLAARHERVIVKVPDSAGSLGNLPLDSEQIRSRPLAELRSWLMETLASLHWEGGWPLLVGVWDSPAIGSPSVQTWIPDLADGPPVIEGVFDQIVQGPRGRFVGSAPAELPSRWIEALVRESGLLAGLLQRLGYFGRCSFDAVLAGRSPDEAELHWIECNGRWGGVSIPMTLANRLVGDWRNRPFVVVQREVGPLPRLTVDQAIDRLGDHLFRPESNDNEGAVFLTPRLMAEARGLHFLALGRTAERARAIARECITLLSMPAR